MTLGTVGQQIETILLAWYILALTDSPFMSSLVIAARLAPNLMALYAGTIVDRMPRHLILAVVGLAWTSLAFLMFILLVTDMFEIWHVFGVAFAGGLVRTFQMPAGQSLAADSVTPERIPNAVALINTGMDVSLIFGPLMFGFLFEAYGPEGVYALITVLYAASGISALFIQVQQSTLAKKKESVWIMVSRGLLYVKANQVLWAALVLAVIINLTGFPLHTTLMPVFAKDVLEVGPGGLSILIFAFGVGSLIGSFAQAFLARLGHTGVRLLVAVIVWHGSMAVFATSSSYTLSIGILVITGMAFSSTLVLILTVLLRTASREYRGRITGIRVLAIYAHTFGSMAAGAMAGLWGAPTAATINGLVGIFLVLVLVTLTPKFRRV